MSTKKLAKKLGLVRKRSQSSTGQKKPLVSNQIFSYLIVIDFESTCWREKNNYGQEIIEFPAVLLNTSTGEVESEFHTYVQPQEHPVLSEFCTELTGITQRQVEAGVPLQICLSRFSRWLQTLQLQRGIAFPRDQRGSAALASQKPCAFLTWSDWDLGVCLQYECKRKQLHKPDVLNSWIDLRATYRLFYNRKPKGLNGALQDLGIKFSGREHSGLDDARNTAQLAARMMRDGCVMKITRSQERAPLKDKPFFGNANGHASKQKEKDKNTKEEKVQSKIKTPSSKTPPQLKSPAHESQGSSNPKRDPVQGHQSLVAPRTLLNGLTTPLLGSSSSSSRFVKIETATRLSSPIVTNAPLPHKNGNSVVLFSTTVDCLSHHPQPNMTSEPEAAGGLWEEEEGAAILVETEERCGSYDDVVLEGDDFTRDLYVENEMFDIEEDTSSSDRGGSLQEESVISHSVKGPANLMASHSVTKIPHVEKTPKPEVSRSSNTSVSLTKRRSQSKTYVSLNETRHSSVSLPGPSFAVPKAVSSSSKSPSSSSRQATVALGKPSPTQFQGESRMPHNPSITLNTSSFIRTTALVPYKTSTPDRFAKPKPISTEQSPFGRYSRGHKGTVKNNFTIYTDPAKPSTTASRPSSRGSLCSSSLIHPPSILSSSTNRSSLQSASRGKVSKITSPLCACGRRAKRLTVANGGPNHGRGFYCCPVRRSGIGNRIQRGCEFFKWESALLKANCPATLAARSSVSLCFNSSLHHRPLRTSSSLSRKSC